MSWSMHLTQVWQSLATILCPVLDMTAEGCGAKLDRNETHAEKSHSAIWKNWTKQGCVA